MEIIKNVPIEVSSRHIHISAKDYSKLFPDRELTVLKSLSQTDQFAAEETVILRTPKGSIPNVRIVGPFRDHTQIEVSVHDCRTLGITPHFSISGSLENSPGIIIEGTKGSLTLDSGVIVPLTHIHMSPAESASHGLSHLDTVTIKIKGARTVSFHGVVIRSRENIDSLSLHLDTDQANAVGNISEAEIISIEKESHEH